MATPDENLYKSPRSGFDQNRRQSKLQDWIVDGAFLIVMAMIVLALCLPANFVAN